jgi:RNA polymerase sigma factor (sigma-70 family)
VKFSNPALYELTDEELMIKTGQDDQKSFCVLYDRYKLKIYQFLAWNTGSKARAEELMQDVFLKIYLNRKQYRPQSFRAWIYTIARNILIDWSRKKKEYQFEDDQGYEKHTSDDLLEVQEVLILQQEKRELYEAIDELSPRLKEALTLWMTEDWSTEEMAEILHCSNQAVKNLIHRAKRELYEYFEEPSSQSPRSRK